MESQETVTLDKNDKTENAPAEKTAAPVFTFRRMSGLDQAILDTDSQWQNLDKLDPQIWMALSCPTKGLEFNQDTLAELDTDKDGRIRAQDVRDAVAWVCERVVHPAALCQEGARVGMDNLRQDTKGGQACAQALKLVLQKNNASGQSASLEEISEVLAEASGYAFNGDGVITLQSARESHADAAVLAWLPLALSIVGGKLDATGQPGIDKDLAAELEKMVQASLDWRRSLKTANLALGENTGAAWVLYQRLAPKISDYFARCHLAAFDPEALARMNASEEDKPLSQFNEETLLALPLARISSQPVLNLQSGLNPAWSADLEKFAALVAPALPAKAVAKTLDEKTWGDIKNIFGQYSEILNKKPEVPLPPADAQAAVFPDLPPLVLAPADDPLGRSFLPPQPNENISAFTDDELESLLNPQTKNSLLRLMDRDLAAPPLSSFQDLRKLALFHAYLYTFLMNFISFIDFYDPKKKGIFQEGVLYLDSRACYLCVPVENVDDHARLAGQSHLCLIYCSCSRKAADGAEQTGTIAAALTIGNLVSLIEGRHGVFIDNAGEEWDTKILRVVHNPISLREAVWAPYVRISNMVAEQANKFIAAKDKAAGDALQKAVSTATAKPAEPKQGFDFAKGAGIFAAVSVALSVLSAAFAYIANSLASLGWWWPLALVGIFICISGPSALIAYFKLRKRSLGPLLDASGWAVNNGAPINIMMGMALTKPGKLPPNAAHNYDDPYSLPARMKQKKSWWKFWLFLILLLILIAVCFGLYCQFIAEPMWVTKGRLFLGI